MSRPGAYLSLPHIALLWGLATGLAALPGQVPATPAREARAVPVTVTRAATRDLPETARTLGRVRALRLATVAAEVPGRVVEIPVRVGQPVRRGDLLARLDEADLRLEAESDRAAVARVTALRDAQRRKLRRLERLRRHDQIPEEALDEARAALAALEAELAGARARLRLAERRLAKARILAPDDGVVDARLVAPGDWVGPGTPVARLAAAGREVVLPFPERLAGRLRPGLAVRLASPAGGNTALLRLDAVRPTLGAGGHAVEAVVRLPATVPWPPGASVDAEVTLAVHRGAVTVPETSVVLRPAGTVVYMIEGGRAHERRVHTGLRRDGLVEIVSGLAAGETVAVDGAAFLSDGAPVEVRGGEDAGQHLPATPAHPASPLARRRPLARTP